MPILPCTDSSSISFGRSCFPDILRPHLRYLSPFSTDCYHTMVSVLHHPSDADKKQPALLPTVTRYSDCYTLSRCNWMLICNDISGSLWLALSKMIPFLYIDQNTRYIILFSPFAHCFYHLFAHHCNIFI